jgi:sugar phosphate isomerase/epimerase
VFTKPFRELDPRKTADLVAEVGWDGVELPVRSKDGQITPEKVQDDLPRYAEALRSKGKEVTIVTTEITEVNAAAEKVLRTASRLGIKRYRLGFYRYRTDKPIPQQLTEIGARLRDLAALNKELGLRAGFQNHSGNGYVGAPIWDVWTMIKELDPAQIGYCFDIGHATLEAGESWPTNFRLAQPWLTAIFVKDFYWSKGDKGWKPTWCALGEGMVSPSFFKTLKLSAYDGPICQHHEYEWKTDPMTHYKQDLATLRKLLA